MHHQSCRGCFRLLNLCIAFIIGIIPPALSRTTQKNGFRSNTESYAQSRRTCERERSADQQIAGCTGVIGKHRPSDEMLAIALSNRGSAYRTRGKLDEALSDFDRALQVEPTYYPALFNRADTYAATNNYERAIADYSKLLDDLDYAAMIWQHRGHRVLRGTADLISGAETAARTTFAFHAYWNAARLSRALMYFKIGDLERAARDITRSLWGKAPDALFFRRRAQKFIRQGMLQFAYSGLQAALRVAPDARLHREFQEAAQLLADGALTKEGISASPMLLSLADSEDGSRLAVTVQAFFEHRDMQSASAVLEFVSGHTSPVLRVATFYFGAPRHYSSAVDKEGRELPLAGRRTVVQLEEDETCGYPECPFMSNFLVPLDFSLLRSRSGQGLQITIKDAQARRLMINISASAIGSLLTRLEPAPL